MAIFLEDVSNKWKSATARADSLTVLSPYITSSAFIKSEGNVYTSFTAENFITGASSIGALRRLLKKGCQLFHVENLHAKIVMTENFISVGSQNQTNQGQNNKEATYIRKGAFTGPASIEVSKWTKDAISIDENSLKLMEEKIKDLIKEYKRFKDKFATIDNLVHTPKEIRTILSKSLTSKAAQNIDASIDYSDEDYGRIKDTSSDPDNYRFSLQKYYRDSDFTQWILKQSDTRVALKEYNRYVLFDADSGRLSWARIHKSVITFYGKSVTRVDRKIRFIGELYEMTFNAIWDSSEHNLQIVLTNDLQKHVMNCFFDLREFHNVEIVESDFDKESIVKNFSVHTGFLQHHILGTFRYKHNANGPKADTFFDSEDAFKTLRLTKIDEYPVLTVSTW